MKGKVSLSDNIKLKLRFRLNLQLFAEKRISDIGIKLQNNVSNQKLKNLIGELYREGATIGDGIAMAAASYQIKTGNLVAGKDHIKKIEERISNLTNIMKSQNLNSNDKDLAVKLLKDMNESLRGKY